MPRQHHLEDTLAAAHDVLPASEDVGSSRNTGKPADLGPHTLVPVLPEPSPPLPPPPPLGDISAEVPPSPDVRESSWQQQYEEIETKVGKMTPPSWKMEDPPPDDYVAPPPDDGAASTPVDTLRRGPSAPPPPRSPPEGREAPPSVDPPPAGFATPPAADPPPDCYAAPSQPSRVQLYYCSLCEESFTGPTYLLHRCKAVSRDRRVPEKRQDVSPILENLLQLLPASHDAPRASEDVGSPRDTGKTPPLQQQPTEDPPTGAPPPADVTRTSQPEQQYDDSEMKVGKMSPPYWDLEDSPADNFMTPLPDDSAVSHLEKPPLHGYTTPPPADPPPNRYPAQTPVDTLPEDDTGPQQQPSKARPHHCLVCDKWFTSAPFLSRHYLSASHKRFAAEEERISVPGNRKLRQLLLDPSGALVPPEAVRSGRPPGAAPHTALEPPALPPPGVDGSSRVQQQNEETEMEPENMSPPYCRPEDTPLDDYTAPPPDGGRVMPQAYSLPEGYGAPPPVASPPDGYGTLPATAPPPDRYGAPNLTDSFPRGGTGPPSAGNASFTRKLLPYRCTVCRLQFRKKMYLRRHCKRESHRRIVALRTGQPYEPSSKKSRQSGPALEGAVLASEGFGGSCDTAGVDSGEPADIRPRALAPPPPEAPLPWGPPPPPEAPLPWGPPPLPPDIWNSSHAQVFSAPPQLLGVSRPTRDDSGVPAYTVPSSRPSVYEWPHHALPGSLDAQLHRMPSVPDGPEYGLGLQTWHGAPQSQLRVSAHREVWRRLQQEEWHNLYLRHLLQQQQQQQLRNCQLRHGSQSLPASAASECGSTLAVTADGTGIGITTEKSLLPFCNGATYRNGQEGERQNAVQTVSKENPCGRESRKRHCPPAPSLPQSTSVTANFCGREDVGRPRFRCPNVTVGTPLSILPPRQTHAVAPPVAPVVGCPESARICPVCGGGFSREYSLREHVQYFHPGSEYFECGHCGVAFATLWSYRTHLAEHGTGAAAGRRSPARGCTDKKRPTGPGEPNFSDRPFGCDRCPKQFVRKQHLTRHKLLHSGV